MPSGKLINPILDHHRTYLAFVSRKVNLLIFILSVGLFVALFLNLFLPFGTSGARVADGPALSGPLRVIYLSLFGAAWSATLASLEFLLRPLLERYCNIRQSAATHLLWLAGELLAVAFITFMLRGFLSNWRSFTLDNFTEMAYATVLLFLFPYLGFTFYYKSQVPHNSTFRDDSARLLFSSDTGNEQVEVPCDRLIYIAAEDNYIRIIYLRKGALSSHLLRATLRSAAAVANHPRLVRTHRSYLVNLDFVQSFSGNSNGLKLKLCHVEHLIPVAKAYVRDIERQLNHRQALRNKTVL